MKNPMQQSASKRALAEIQAKAISRRELFLRAGQGATALLFLAALQEHAEAAPTHRQPKGGALSLLKDGAIVPKQQFPYYTDAPWDKPQYFETIYAGRKIFPKTHQSADIDGDGRDELIARGPGGIHIDHYDPESGQWTPMKNGPHCPDADGWDQRPYYDTFQCADIDGDGKAEILARGAIGITIWKYAPSSTGDWKTLNPGPALSDANGWDQPQFYRTIQFADIDGNNRAELIARGADGIVAWRYEPSNDSWSRLPNGPAWSDAVAWNRPEYYTTIQCADVDGDGWAELIGRGEAGLITYKFTGQKWEELPSSFGESDWSDNWGWNQPQYFETIQFADVLGTGVVQAVGYGPYGLDIYQYDATRGLWEDYVRNQPLTDLSKAEYFQTFQCADVDGDGKAEILARNANGLQIWKYENQSLRQLPAMAAWSDVNKWNKVQYYATIQSARGLKPGDIGYTGDGVHTQALLLGRGSLGMQTYRFIGEQAGWKQTSAELPVFTEKQQHAYEQIPRALEIQSFILDIRSTYNNTIYAIQGMFAEWQGRLYNTEPAPGFYDQPVSERPDCSLPLPDGVEQTDWDEVTWQIYWELQWVRNIYAWYSSDAAGGLIDKDYIAQQITLQRVGDYLNYDNDSSATVAFTILALIASAAAAILTGGASLGGELAVGLGIASAVAGGMSSAFSAVPGLTPGDSTYKNLQSAINSRYLDAVTAQGKLLFALTGGADHGAYSPADYGRFKLIGEWIQKGVWAWDTSSTGGATSDYLVQAARGYATYVWQTLIQTSQSRWFINTAPIIPDTFPTQYRFHDPSWNRDVHVMSNWGEISNDTLNTVFGSISDTAPFPLGVPVKDVYLGEGGWPQLPQIWVDNDNEPVILAVPPRDVHVQPLANLSRDSVTGEIVAEVQLRNLGMTSATNVEITDARLGINPMIANHAGKAYHIFFGHPQTLQLRFPPMTGTTFVLRLSGSYEGGSFGGSYRLKLS